MVDYGVRRMAQLTRRQICNDKVTVVQPSDDTDISLLTSSLLKTY